MGRLWSLAKAYLHTCRYEYFPGEAPAMLVPLFLTSSSFSDMINIEIIAGLAAFLLLFLSGFTINAYTDRKLDENYDSFKRNISSSVRVIGAKRLLHLTIAQVALALVISAWIAWRMGAWWLYGMVLVGVFFGIGYSIKPLNFKERGSIWHAVALGTSIFFIPLLFLYFIAAGELTVFVVILAVGFSIVHYAMEYGNQANDYLEDRAANVMTPPVRLGISKSLRVAMWMFVVGAITVAYSFHYLIFTNEALMAMYSNAALWLVVLVIWGIFAAGYYLPFQGLRRMWAISATTKDIDRDMPLIKQQCNYSRWQTSGITAFLFVSIIIFGTNSVVLDVSVEPGLSPVFSEEPSVSLVKQGTIFPNYYADSVIFIRSGTYEVESGTLQVRIALEADSQVYDTMTINVTHHLLPRETWTRYVRLDIHDRGATTITFTLLEDDDDDGVYSVELDRRSKQVTPPSPRGSSTGADTLGADLPELPFDLPVDWDRRWA